MRKYIFHFVFSLPAAFLICTFLSIALCSCKKDNSKKGDYLSGKFNNKSLNFIDNNKALWVDSFSYCSMEGTDTSQKGGILLYIFPRNSNNGNDPNLVPGSYYFEHTLSYPSVADYEGVIFYQDQTPGLYQAYHNISNPFVITIDEVNAKFVSGSFKGTLAKVYNNVFDSTDTVVVSGKFNFDFVKN